MLIKKKTDLTNLLRSTKAIKINVHTKQILRNNTTNYCWTPLPKTGWYCTGLATKLNDSKHTSLCFVLCLIEWYSFLIVKKLSITTNSITISKQVTPGLISLYQMCSFLQNKVYACAYNPCKKMLKSWFLQHSHSRQSHDSLRVRLLCLTSTSDIPTDTLSWFSQELLSATAFFLHQFLQAWAPLHLNYQTTHFSCLNKHILLQLLTC